MGIYIKGMDMPKKSICVEIFSDGGVHEFADPRIIGLASSVDIEDMPSAQPEVTEEDVKEYCRKRCLCVIDSALLKKYAFARPDQKQGKWIYNQKDAFEVMFTLPKCSECWHESSDALNYCPNCGARMDTEGE